MKSLLLKIPLTLWLIWIIAGFNGLIYFAGVGGNDGWGYYMSLETLIDDHDLDVRNNLKAKGSDGRYLGANPVAGTDPIKYKNGYSFGHTLVYALPFWAGGLAADLWDGKIDTKKLPEDSPYYNQETKTIVRIVFCVAWTNLLTLCLLSVMYWMAFKISANHKTAFAATLLCWLSSPLPFYANNMMSHVASTLLFALAFIPVLKKSEGYYVMGLLSGLATLPREANMMIGVAIGIDAFYRGKIPGFVRYSSGYLTVFTFNLFQWWLRNGHPLKLGTSLHMGPPSDHPPVYNMLIDPRGGFLIWFPAMAIAGFYSFKLCKTKSEYRPFVILASMLVLSYSLRYEYNTSGFGQRFLCPLAFLLMPGMIEAFKHHKVRIALYICTAFSSMLYVLHKSKHVHETADYNPYMGAWISNYTKIFEEPISTWPEILISGSFSLKILLDKPLLLLFVIAIPTAFLYWLNKYQLKQAEK